MKIIYCLVVLFICSSNEGGKTTLYPPEQYSTDAERSTVKQVYPLDTVSQLMYEFYRTQNIVGMSYSISIDSVMILSNGLGYMDIDRTIPVDPAETLFRIASLSKPITATTLGTLIDQGIMDLDQSVYHYVPDFPKKTYDFSVRNLAGHTSGIRHYKWYERENTKDFTIEEGLKKFKRSKLAFPPGSKYQYSSYAYNLLGVAMQNAANKPYETIVRENVLDKLSMHHTIPDKGSYEGYEVTGFFKQKNGNIKQDKNVNIYFKLPSGGYLSTSEDLLKLGNSYIYNTVLHPETQQELTTQQTINGKLIRNGLGWGVSKDSKGRIYYSHSGGGVGAVSRILIYPEERLCINVLVNTNCDYMSLVNLVSQIAAIIIKSKKP